MEISVPGIHSWTFTGNGSVAIDDVQFNPVRFCAADFNSDGLVDFADYLIFLDLYAGEDARADLDGDGFVDFVDYLEFLNHYDAGC